MKWIILFFLTFSFLNASPFILTQEEKQKIKQHPDGVVIATRFSRFYKFLEEAKEFETHKKLIRTNFFVNKIISKYDDATNSWSTPKEFLINGFGDCEDYALTKYFTLLHLGFSKKNLYLAVVKVKGSAGLHMVTLYKDRDGTLLTFDNLSWKLKAIWDRSDLIFQYALNEKEAYILKEKKLHLTDKPNANGMLKHFQKYLKNL
jgi:predicted transglutaminase-like cysteine proteinase